MPTPRKKQKSSPPRAKKAVAKKTPATTDQKPRRAYTKAQLKRKAESVRRQRIRDKARQQAVARGEEFQDEVVHSTQQATRTRYKGSAHEGFTQFIYEVGFSELTKAMFPEDMLAGVALRTMWISPAGVPHDARYRPLFGKRDIEIAQGRRGFKETEYEDLAKITGAVATVDESKWDFALPGWEANLRQTKSLIPPKVKALLNRKLADRAVEFFGKLRLADVPGNPTLEEAAGDWFREIVEVVIGCYDPRTKQRMIKELFVLIPKKNMKTTGGALIMLLIMIYNERPQGQAVMSAPVHEVAEVAFDAIKGAIELDPELSRVFEVKAHYKTIIDRRKETKDAELRVVTFDPAVLTGQKFFAALIDELHVISKNPKASSALRQIRGNMLPFPEAILIFITTQSEEAPAGVFLTELTSARQVRDGLKVGGRLLPILYEFPEDMQKDTKNQPWRNPEVWHWVNPNIGRSITLKALVTLYKDAESKGEAELRSWASQHLNIEIGLALRSDSWAGATLWDKGAIDPTITLESMIKRCEVIELGIDGGGMDDLLALGAAGRDKETKNWLIWTKAWAHPIVFDRNKQVESQLLEFKKSGDLSVVETPGQDLEELVKLVMLVHDSGLLDKIGLDPYGVGVIVDAILAEGIAPETLSGVSQGWRMSGVVQTVERTVFGGKIVHGNQKILNWAVSNAKIERKGNAILITKAASGSAKIDPLMAVLDAVSILATNPAAKGKKFQMFVLGGKPK